MYDKLLEPAELADLTTDLVAEDNGLTEAGVEYLSGYLDGEHSVTSVFKLARHDALLAADLVQVPDEPAYRDDTPGPYCDWRREEMAYCGQSPVSDTWAELLRWHEEVYLNLDHAEAIDLVALRCWLTTVARYDGYDYGWPGNRHVDSDVDVDPLSALQRLLSALKAAELSEEE